MKFSIVIPAYNEEKMLPDCLSSFYKQDFPKTEFEIIVVDNNSTDNTAAIARTFGARVVFESRKGIAYARNTGALAAHGDIIVGTDADCVVPEDFLEKLDSMYSNPTTVGVCGTVTLTDAPWIISGGAVLLSTYGHWYSNVFNRTPIAWALNFSFRRKEFRAVGGYTLDLPLLIAGQNTHGSDETNLVQKLTTTGKTVLFNKNITLQTSARRFKNRLLYWIVVEHILGFTVNEWLQKTFGVIVPISSYYDRPSPEKFYRYVYRLVAITSLFFIVSVAGVWHATPQYYKEEYQQELNAEAQKKYKQFITIKANVEHFSDQIDIAEKITPYFNKYTSETYN